MSENRGMTAEEAEKFLQMVRRRRITAGELGKALEGMATAKCAFCDGTGKDPFGLLSKLSTCQVCGGRGVNRVREPITTCNFCKGTGIQRYTTSRLHCSACGGKGVVAAVEPATKCERCNGTGIYPHSPAPPLSVSLPCPVCRGQGAVHPRSQPAEEKSLS